MQLNIYLETHIVALNVISYPGKLQKSRNMYKKSSLWAKFHEIDDWLLILSTCTVNYHYHLERGIMAYNEVDVLIY